jgi:hypothetical protein
LHAFLSFFFSLYNTRSFEYFFFYLRILIIYIEIWQLCAPHIYYLKDTLIQFIKEIRLHLPSTYSSCNDYSFIVLSIMTNKDSAWSNISSVCVQTIVCGRCTIALDRAKVSRTWKQVLFLMVSWSFIYRYASKGGPVIDWMVVAKNFKNKARDEQDLVYQDYWNLLYEPIALVRSHDFKMKKAGGPSSTRWEKKNMQGVSLLAHEMVCGGGNGNGESPLW